MIEEVEQQSNFSWPNWKIKHNLNDRRNYREDENEW